MADTTGPFRDVLPLPHPDFGSGIVGDSFGAMRSGFAGASSSSRSPQPAGPRVIGDLEILGELARGGMGVVYRAMDRRLGREVAVKVLLTGGTADLEELERFAVEARAAARLKHPGIVGIHRVGEDRGAPYMVMDLVPGESLHKRLGRDGPLPLREAARLCARLARALAFAHGRGVLHRDLKPHNVLLTPEGEPILTDFGLAKEVVEGHGRGLTVTGQVLGTPAYMSPEQARGDGERVDRRADIYGLGATLYAALTGRPPFAGGSAIAVLAKVVEEQVEPPRRSRAEVDRDLETIVLKCLEKEPAARYDTAQDLADDLDRYLAGEPVRARRLGGLARAARWVGRHRLASAAVALAVSLPLAVGVATTFLEQDRVVARARVAAEEAQVPLAADASLDARLGHALNRLQAAQRWRDLAGTPEAHRAQVEAAFALGAVARDGGQWDLARHAYRLSGLDAADPKLTQALQETEDASTADVRRRREAVVAALDALVRGDATDPRETVFVLVRYPDAGTVDLLSERLRGAIDVLVRTRRETLLEAVRPTSLEARAGWRPLDALPGAIALLEGEDALPTDDDATEAAGRVVREAVARLARRDKANMAGVLGVSDVAEGWKAVARAQRVALTEGGVRQARACVEALGRIGGASPAVAQAALRAYLRADLDPAGTRLAARALGALKTNFEQRRQLIETRIGPLESAIDMLDPSSLAEDDDSPGGVQRRVMGLMVRGDDAGAFAALEAGLVRWPNEVKLLLTRATMSMTAGRVKAAQVDAERIVALTQDAVSFGLRGWVRATLGDVEGARRDLGEAERRLTPAVGDYAWMMVGQTHFVLGEYAVAETYLKRALELDPTATTAALNLAQCLLAQRKFEEARSVIARTLEIEPDNVHALLARADVRSLTRDTTGALDDLERVHALAPGLATAAEKRANLLLRTGRLDDAARAARELLSRMPDHPGAHWTLAQVALTERRPEVAEEHCQRGLRSDALMIDDRVCLLTALANARLLLGRHAEALQAANAAVELSPDDLDALVLRAAVHSRQGDLPKALADLDRGIEVDGDSLQLLMARAHVHLGLRDRDAAARDLERVVALDASAVTAQVLLSELAVARGDLEAAERQLTRAIEATPGVAELKIRRGEVRMRVGDDRGARADLDQALIEEPMSIFAWFRRAQLRLKQGDLAGAQADIQSAAELEPRDPELVEGVAVVMASAGLVDRALALVEAALPLQPDPASRARLERVRADLRSRR